MVYFLLFSKGVPDHPQNLALEGSSFELLSPVLSWQRPSNIPDDVVLTYHLKVTNITSSVEVFNDVFNMTGVELKQLPVGSGCSLFEFNVTALNDVGNSTTESINGTMPISKSLHSENKFNWKPIM